MSMEPIKRAGQVVNCSRCHVQLIVASKRRADGRFIRLSDGEGKGYCLNCVVTWFFQSNEMQFAAGPTAAGLAAGAPPGNNCLPEALRLLHVRAQFAAILKAGRADAPIALIDWDEVIANWHLPFPKGQKMGLF